MSETSADPTQWNFMNPVFEVSDVRRSQAFYRDTLGLEPHWIWQDRIGGVLTGSLQLYLTHRSLARGPQPGGPP